MKRITEKQWKEYDKGCKSLQRLAAKLRDNPEFFLKKERK